MMVLLKMQNKLISFHQLIPIILLLFSSSPTLFCFDLFNFFKSSWCSIWDINSIFLPTKQCIWRLSKNILSYQTLKHILKLLIQITSSFLHFVVLKISVFLLSCSTPFSNSSTCWVNKVNYFTLVFEFCSLFFCFASSCPIQGRLVFSLGVL